MKRFIYLKLESGESLDPVASTTPRGPRGDPGPLRVLMLSFAADRLDLSLKIDDELSDARLAHRLDPAQRFIKNSPLMLWEIWFAGNAPNLAAIKSGAWRARFGRIALQQIAPFLVDDADGPALVVNGGRHEIRRR